MTNTPRKGRPLRLWLLTMALVMGLASLLDAGTVTYTYDDAGRLIRAEYGDGKVITYTYDAAGNLLERQVSGAVEGPDLTGTWLGLSSFRGGRVLQERLQVSNIGTQDAGSFTVAYYLSEDGTTLGGLLRKARVLPLGAGQDRILGFRYGSRSSLSGQYLIAVVDAEEQVPEPDETNNRAVIVIP